jgi:hypothetical protein
MILFKEFIVALVSVLILATSSSLWKLAAHRRRFQDLVCPYAILLT